MRRDLDGTIWLHPDEWIPWVWKNHPERIRGPQGEQPAQQIDPRVEARQWRAGTQQGLLARTSPLFAEKREKAAAK